MQQRVIDAGLAVPRQTLLVVAPQGLDGAAVLLVARRVLVEALQPPRDALEVARQVLQPLPRRAGKEPLEYQPLQLPLHIRLERLRQRPGQRGLDGLPLGDASAGDPTDRLNHGRQAGAAALLLLVERLLRPRRLVIAQQRAVGDGGEPVVAERVGVAEHARLQGHRLEAGQRLLPLLEGVLEFKPQQAARPGAVAGRGGLGRVEEAQRDRVALVDQCRVADQLAPTAREGDLGRQVAEVPGLDAGALHLRLVALGEGEARRLGQLRAQQRQLAAVGQLAALVVDHAVAQPQVRRQLDAGKAVLRHLYAVLFGEVGGQSRQQLPAAVLERFQRAGHAVGHRHADAAQRLGQALDE